MIQDYISFLRKVLSPPLCYGCKVSLQEYGLCKNCLYTILPVAPLDIIYAKNHTMQVYALGAYQGILRQLILKKAYKDPAVWDILAQQYVEFSGINITSYDYYIPVPLHWMRYAYRGFNQASLLAYGMSKHTKVPVLDSVLFREKYTPYQYLIPQSDRHQALHKAFFVKEDPFQQLAGKRILLIDDVCTTGTTLESCAAILKKTKALKVDAAVIARVF